MVAHDENIADVKCRRPECTAPAEDYGSQLIVSRIGRGGKFD